MKCCCVSWYRFDRYELQIVKIVLICEPTYKSINIPKKEEKHQEGVEGLKKRRQARKKPNEQDDLRLFFQLCIYAVLPSLFVNYRSFITMCMHEIEKNTMQCVSDWPMFLFKRSVKVRLTLPKWPCVFFRMPQTYIRNVPQGVTLLYRAAKTIELRTCQLFLNDIGIQEPVISTECIYITPRPIERICKLPLP